MGALAPAQTVTFVCGVLMCVIGVSTFVSGLMSRARKDGQIECKVDTVLKSVDEIKDNLNAHTKGQQDILIQLNSHNEKIETLFRNYKEAKHEIDELQTSLYNRRSKQ